MNKNAGCSAYDNNLVQWDLFEDFTGLQSYISVLANLFGTKCQNGSARTCAFQKPEE